LGGQATLSAAVRSTGSLTWRTSRAHRLFSNLANQGLNLRIKTGLNYLGGFVDGGDFIADRPGFIQVGERGAERGGGETINLSLNVNGSLAGMSRSEIKNIVKATYMEVVTKGNSVRRVNASQARRGL